MKMLKSVIYFTLLVTNIVVCEPDYHFDKEVGGWLKLSVVPATWQQAFLSCHYAGAVLASPITLQLSCVMRSLMRRSEMEPTSIFIGANALFSPGDYISIEGVPLADMHVKWSTFDYSEKPENCLRLSENGKVHTTRCDRWLPYICYKKKDENCEINECGTFDNAYALNKSTGKCYKLHDEPRSWNMSYKICAAEGGHLAIINNKEEAAAVTALFPESDEVDPDEWQWEPAHIGLRDWNRDSYTWLTIHGERIENVYHMWAKDQPDNKGVNICGCILRDGTLDDNWCTLETMFICEKDPKTSRFERPIEYKRIPSYYCVHQQ